jgi:DNA polymerase III delta subunit
LHGENIVQSRKRLTEVLDKVRDNGLETVVLDGSRISLSEVRSALESGSLFGKTKLVVVENLLTSQKSKEKERIIEYLNKGKFDNDLIIWEPKEIKSASLLQAQKEVFRLTPLIFRFLGTLAPRNTKESLRLLTELKQTEEPEMILYMLIRQFRFLILACDLGPSGMSELSSWQQKKFLAQSGKFKLEQLKDIYGKLLEIDFAQKTSGDAFSLSSRLDLLVSSL